MKKILILLLALLATTAAKADFLDVLKKRFPQTEGAKVEKAFGNFYSVVQGSEILFVNEDLSILINGEVIDLAKNLSINQELRESARPKVPVSELDLKDAIKFGNGPDKIYVFSDPDCPYCRQLEREFDKLQGVTVYIFPFPLVSLHPNAANISESIWCSNDRAAAWHNYVGRPTEVGATNAGGKSVPQMFRNKKDANAELKAAHCDNPILRNLAFGEKYQLLGTPAIVLSSGRVIPGYVPASRLQAEIEKAKKE